MNRALADYTLALADDELITGHRLSEWTGHAPILEEDIAFANLALDEIGHARLWFEVASKAIGEDPETYPDQQAFFRAPKDFRNLQITELPNGDWAFCMLRQYLFDTLEMVRLDKLKSSSEVSIKEVAAKIAVEEIYHLRHTQAWMKRLALGTEESTRRTQAALNELWPHTAQFAVPLPGEEELVEQGAVPNAVDLHAAWLSQAGEFLSLICELVLPDISANEAPDRSEHTPRLTDLLSEMQEVARHEPEGRW